MINGVELSQLQDVNFTHQNHYRRLTQVEQGQYSRISQLDNSFVKVVHNRKINHQRWKKFQQTKVTIDLDQCNATFRSRLQKIKQGKSIYNSPRQQSPAKSKPSNFYSRQRQQKTIEHRNPEIARRIINVKSSFDRSKTEMEFTKYRQTVHRLERFPVYLRMSSLDKNRFRAKTEGSITPLNINSRGGINLALLTSKPRISISKLHRYTEAIG